MEDRRQGLEYALRCVAAMEGQSEIVRLSLWQEAVAARLKGREAREGRDVPRASLPALGALSGARGLEW